MLGKFKTLMYENWFAFVASLLIALIFLKNIFLAILVYFFILLYARGSFFPSLFFSLIFLPTLFLAIQDLKINFLISVLTFVCLVIYIFFSFKKKKNLPLLTFLFISFFIFYLNFQEKINLPITIIFFAFTVFYFAFIFLHYNLFNSLILTLIFFELSFLMQFLPFSFWWRTLILLIFLLVFIKYDIIKIQLKNN